MSKSGSTANLRIAVACCAMFVTMIGVSFAAVPLYQLFCQVTGYGGTVSKVEQVSDVILDKTINIRFDANTSGSLAWNFEPEQRQITIRIGETAKASYIASNFAASPSHGRSTFNVTPQAAGAYFSKIDCFCFTDTTLQPGESLTMPVVFFVDPEIVNVEELKGVETITLSYTFFAIDPPQAPKVSAANQSPDNSIASN